MYDLHFHFNEVNLIIIIPSGWNYIYMFNRKMHQSLLYMYSSVYYFQIFIPNNYTVIRINSNLNLFQISARIRNNYYKVYWKTLLNVFNIFYKPFFTKLKFKGKGYYIFKNSFNTITTQFGHSHRIYLYSYFVTVKFLSKTNILLFGFHKKDVLQVGNNLLSVKPINIFTGRGIRFNRQIIYKKAGKISSYR